MDSRKERNIGIDVIKTVAVIFVLSVHFFLNTSFYRTNILGKNMYMQVFFQQLFLSCVPLFMVTTGYLNKNVKLNKKYYKKLIPILVVYVFYSILSLILRGALGESFDLKNLIVHILAFTADPYSWYVNMFIGLFLLAPFLNIIYNTLENKNRKHILIGTFIILTSLSTVFNGRYNGILYFPDYWVGLYPLTYYFIGKYLAEFKPNLNRVFGIISLIFIVFLQALLEIIYANEGIMTSLFSQYGALTRVVQTLLIFLILYKIDIKCNIIRGFFIITSSLSLDIYLASYIADKLVYMFLNRYGMSQQQYFYLLIPIVIMVYILSFIISYIRKVSIRIR